MNGSTIEWRPDNQAVRALLDALLAETEPIYVVGGVVRDLLMARVRTETDLDLVVHENALGVARRAADRVGWAYFPLDEARDVARLVFTAGAGQPLICDVAGMRGSSLADDLAARDFTINAMALELRRDRAPVLVDRHNGVGDIDARRIRMVTPTSIAEDPLRMVRAVRFAVDLDFTIDRQAEEQILRITTALKHVSPERLRDEFWKTLGVQEPQQAVERLDQLGLLFFIVPEVHLTTGVEQSYPHYQDVFNHTMLAVEHAAEIRDWVKGVDRDRPPLNPAWQARLARWRPQLQQHFLQRLAGGHLRADMLVWHALLHDVGKPGTRSAERHPTGRVVYRFFDHENVGARMAVARMEALRFSNQEIALDRAVIEAHMRPHHLDVSFGSEPISRRAMYRFFRDVGGQQFRDPVGVDTLLLALADLQAIYADEPPTWMQYLDHVEQLLAFAFGENGLQQTRLEPLVDGFSLMQALALAPGPQIGRLLNEILEAQAADEIRTPDDALALATTLLETEQQGHARTDGPSGESTVNLDE